jgi:FAD:protein FMN transferase
MASPLRLLVDDGAPIRFADAAWRAVVEEFAAVEVAMSRFRETSEITTLHRAQRLPTPSRRLVAGLVAADRARRLTTGRFDERVLGDLERLGSVGIRQAWAVPAGVSRPRRSAGRALPGRSFRRAGRRGPIELDSPVDLGGIGKGLALRWAAHRAALELGDVAFLIDAGGDVVTRGRPSDGAWSIGIEDPDGGEAPVAVCRVDGDGAIATSSVRLARWIDPAGRPVHHLIDPATGEPGGDGLRAVTVAFADPAWAEVWSKALFLEGAAAIGAAARRRGLAAWWVDHRGELSMTPAARQRTGWVRSEALAFGSEALGVA